MPDLALNTSAGHESAAARFRRSGRTQIGTVLTPQSAEYLFELVSHHSTWNAVFDRHGTHVDLDANALPTLSAAHKKALQDHIEATARTGFQYHFANFPLYDIYHSHTALDTNFRTLFEFLNSDEFLSLCRRVTGFEDIAFADAQITRYTAGHFLTRHDDDVAGKNRRAAFVLNLTPRWRPEWGGLLEFYDDDGNVVEGFVPSFNVLNMFRVPQSHAVTYVTPFAGAARYAITGWLRFGSDPARQ